MTGASVTDRPRAPRPPPLAVDPRIAARWVAVRRDQNRRRWKAAAGVLGAVTLGVGGWVVLHSPVLAVHHVIVRGTGHTDRGSVVAAAKLDRRPMIDVDGALTKQRLSALPWVGQVRVRRHLPSTVTIDIVERVPLAQTSATAGPPAVVDADGRVLAVGGDAARVVESAMPPLPTLGGLAQAGVAGATLSPPAQDLLLVLKALQGSSLPPSADRPGAVAFTVAAVTRGADGTVTAALQPGSISAEFGTTDELEAKLTALRSVLAQLAAAPPTGPATIDVRVAAAPVLTDGKKTSSLSTTQRG
ncbi:MAG: cell division protein FtsQ [Acidimicrobiaceae bacterium]|nr:cell division protein FtsQ [Acidimicrobiaceae bacterium]